MRWAVVVLFVQLALLSLVWPKAVSAINFSKVYPAPLEGENEWVELSNQSTTAVMLDGWQLFDQLTQPSKILDLSGKIEAGKTMIFKISPSKLNNSGDGLTLYNPDHEIEDNMSYPSTNLGDSWWLIDSTWQLVKSSSHQDITPSPTLNQTPSVTPSPTIDLSTTPPQNQTPLIEITEVAACPETGNQEWIELFNPTNQKLALINWVIEDAKHQSKLLTTTIPANSYSIYSWEGSLLNNSGDSIFIKNNQHEVIFSLKFTACSRGQSWQKISSDWILAPETPNTPPLNPPITATITPQATQTPTPTSLPSPSVAQLNSEKKPVTLPSPPIKPLRKLPDFSSIQLAENAKSLRVLSKDNSSTPMIKSSHKTVASAIMTSLLLAITAVRHHYEPKHPPTTA